MRARVEGKERKTISLFNIGDQITEEKSNASKSTAFHIERKSSIRATFTYMRQYVKAQFPLDD